jgi:hypothetical protein
MADSIHDELHGLVDRLEDAAEKYPDFRLCIITGPVQTPDGQEETEVDPTAWAEIITGPVQTPDGQRPGKPALFDPPGLSADDEPRQRRAGELLDLLASDAVALLTRAGVDIGNEDSFEPTRLVFWAAENIAAFNKTPHWGEGRGTTAKPSESPGDNEFLEPKADIFTVVALAVRRLVAADLIRKEAGANQPIGEQSEPCAVHRDDEPKPAKVNDRMKAELVTNLETAKGWTAQQWSDHLRCAKATVCGTETWKSLSLLRQQAKAERRNDRRRK